MSKNFLRMPDGEYVKIKNIIKIHITEVYIEDNIIDHFIIKAHFKQNFSEPFGKFKTKEEAQAYLDTIMDTEGMELDSYND